eukprot:TRINITY_DN3441_c0_g2_i1.p3 TRINITY_DN3441_c0_g2~~TRINITY_DN3441_c0_g2_i1.p3  ORF type:complete len:162 (+),score=12.46 TRINITY_DN3441_c0_g2_i1:1869-2354(+)
MQALSAMTSAELATAAHKGSLGEVMASKLPELEADFVDGACNNMLLGVMPTCGVVTPARFAEQLCSSRNKKPQSNLLMLLANWMAKIHSDAIAVASSAAEKSGRPGKHRRFDDGQSGPDIKGRSRDGSMSDSGEGGGERGVVRSILMRRQKLCDMGPWPGG